jgi:hypothetical protein
VGVPGAEGDAMDGRGMKDEWLVDVTSWGDSTRRLVDPRTLPPLEPLPPVVYQVVQELVGKQPPKGDEECSCGKPATIPTLWEGCKHCGGGECGDSADVFWICEDCFAPTRARNDSPPT